MPWYKKIYYFIRHRTFDVYHKIDTGLEPGYYDIVELMVFGMFALLVRFVDEEYNGVTDIQSHIKELQECITNEGVKTPQVIPQLTRQIRSLEEAIRIYRWWKEEYPKYEIELEKISGMQRIEYKELIEAETEAHLISLVKIRESLWT